MIKYPALYASLEPATAPDGRRGETVRCTATHRALGFVWWSCTAGNVVVWHFRTDGVSGECSTKRNCVQALRDVSNGQAVLPLAPGPAAPPVKGPVTKKRPTTGETTVERAHRILAREIVLPAPPMPARSIVWDDAAPAFDVTAALAAGFKRRTT